MTDPIADLLTRIRNAIMAGHKVVEAPASNLKKEVARFCLKKVIFSAIRLLMVMDRRVF